jgi:hypothetical protein
MGEEMDSARWTLPPIVPLVVGLVIVVIVVGIVLVGGRAKPGASASITGVHAVDKKGQPGVLAIVHVHINNVGDKPIWIKSSSVTVDTDQGKWTDDAAPASDFKRYLQAYPELQQYEKPPLSAEMKIAPGAQVDGMLLVGYPPPPEPNATTPPADFKVADFDKRKGLTVTIDLYDRRPLEIQEKR